MPKKGGKKKTKGGPKPAAVAAVDKVADATKTVGKPDNEAEAESTEQALAPAAEPKAEEIPAAPAVTETKEAEKIAPAAVEKEDVQDAVDKAQASKAGTIGTLDGGDEEGKAVLPESTNKESTLGANLYPSTTETAAEESATSTAAMTGVAAAPTSLPERLKTSETTAAAAQPAVLPSESEAAHIKRPYEKPIFSNDEVKPHKMPKTEEEQAAGGAAADKKVLAGAGPAATAAYTAPEPVPVVTEAPKKVEEKPIAEPAAPKPTADGTSKASPEAVAAAAAAINTSKTDKSAALAGENELKKPEAVLKRGEEPKPEIPKKDVPAKEPAPQEPAPATEETKPSEPTTEQPEKKKGGFFGWLKRKFK